MLLKNAYYLNRDLKTEKANLIIEDGKIRVLDNLDLFKQDFIYTEDIETIDCSNFIIIPGLVNGHYHNGSLLAKGLSKEIGINEWEGQSLQGRLQAALFGYLDEGLSEEEYITVCLKGYIDLIKNGITFVCDSGTSDRKADYLADAMKILGIRGVIDVEDKIGEYIAPSNNDIQYTSHLPEEEDISDNALEKCHRIIEKYNPLMMTHCLENKWRKELINDKYGKSTVELFDENNLLSEKTILFHCVELSDKDIKIISDRGSTIVHCPVSNIAGGGIANIKDCLRSSINICLGTDWARYDIWEVMRFSYFLLKLNTERREFSAEDVFKMATYNGAKAFGMEDKIGVIEDGYDADLVFINKNDPRLYPLIDNTEFTTIIHNMIIECRQDMIEHVMVKGKWVMRNKNIVNIDENRITKEYMRIVQKIFSQFS